MFRDDPIQYPDENTVLGRYLGPAIGVGLEITANIMKENGEVVHSLTLLNIFYPRTQIGFHVEPDPDIRQSTGFPFQLCMSKESPVDSLEINSLFNDVTIENITPITTTYQVVMGSTCFA